MSGFGGCTVFADASKIHRGSPDQDEGPSGRANNSDVSKNPIVLDRKRLSEFALDLIFDIVFENQSEFGQNEINM